MATRREMICGFVLAPTPLGGEPSGRDAHLAALAAEYRRFDEEINALEQAADELWLAEANANRDHSPCYLAMREEVDALCGAKGRVANAIIGRPAIDWAGVARKLALWRREAATVHAYDFDSAHETFTFSAYQDVLRLSGLTSLAHPNDAKMARRMRDYW